MDTAAAALLGDYPDKTTDLAVCYLKVAALHYGVVTVAEAPDLTGSRFDEASDAGFGE